MIRRTATVTIALLVGLTATAGADVLVDAGRGPIQVDVPPGYDPNVPAPLVLLLHGYSSSGEGQEAYMRFRPLADERGFLYAAPDGKVDLFGLRFWNATDACCDFFGNSDDSGYLRRLIEAIQAELAVDDRRIYLIGHSNGGYMSYRMACDHSDLIAGIASLAGATWLDPNECNPTEPVHVLQMHGSGDGVVLFGGGCFDGAGCYPGAVDTVRQWSDHNGCTGAPVQKDPLNLDVLVAGEETIVAGNEAGCPAGGSVELWAMLGSSHVPLLSSQWNDQVIDHLLARPKP